MFSFWCSVTVQFCSKVYLNTITKNKYVTEGVLVLSKGPVHTVPICNCAQIGVHCIQGRQCTAMHILMDMDFFLIFAFKSGDPAHKMYPQTPYFLGGNMYLVQLLCCFPILCTFKSNFKQSCQYTVQWHSLLQQLKQNLDVQLT